MKPQFYIVKNNGKYYVHDSQNFWGDMMIYGKDSESPYIRRMGTIVYLTDELKAELKDFMSRL